MMPRRPPRGLRVARAVDARGEQVFVFSYPTPEAGHAALTPAERAVAQGLLGGRSRKQIASERGVSLATVHKQIESTYEKLGVRSRAELARLLLSGSHGDENVPAGTDPLDSLSPREREVVALAALGHPNKLIAYELGISVSSVASLMACAECPSGIRRRFQFGRLRQLLTNDTVRTLEIHQTADIRFVTAASRHRMMSERLAPITSHRK